MRYIPIPYCFSNTMCWACFKILFYFFVILGRIWSIRRHGSRPNWKRLRSRPSPHRRRPTISLIRSMSWKGISLLRHGMSNVSSNQFCKESTYNLHREFPHCSNLCKSSCVKRVFCSQLWHCRDMDRSHHRQFACVRPVRKISRHLLSLWYSV